MERHIIVDQYGAFVGKKSERLVVRKEKEVLVEVPFVDLEQLTIASGGVSMSTDVIRECMEQGIQINFLSSSGKPYAKITSPHLSGMVLTRREQLLSYYDDRGLKLARAFVDGKIRNQINVLKYFAKHRKRADVELHRKLYEAAGKMDAIRGELNHLEAANIEAVRAQMMSVEGRAADEYWQMVGEVILGKTEFVGREHRGATDPFNSLLNYGYGILYQQVTGALLLAGLEPYGGFLHADRSGKPSLALDFIEEFRAQVVDRTVIAMISKGFEPELEDGRLSQKTRRELADRVLERLESTERYEGEKHRVKTIIQRQARHLATFVRREGNYRPFVASW
ncbi:MAG TPA: CRISPR-associated endonuclease Cas1 [Firmicutes bacterium]|nr:CRISPR-associated endonuclease Cas1 [Bacillota bacterium]